jgi:UDP-N-acetylglucosamine--N-acetylmuramyl-(pentapeptide) pyrophosphoryl-undecaprenol N-acetylglucosamine transferase
MMAPAQSPVGVTIACGGTGGHLFPGLAVADQLKRHGCATTLLVSSKDVDQQAVKGLSGIEVIALPAVGLKRGGEIAFLRGFIRSYRAAAKLFHLRPPQAALAMGGFTSAPPILAARRAGAYVFLHESNTIPGRANRWLARFVHRAFVGFPTAAGRLRSRNKTVTGTPVRACFEPRDEMACRAALGLDPSRPVLLVMGGSQGASGINDLVVGSLTLLAERAPDLQWLHLTGTTDFERVREAYSARKLKAVVQPFFDRMEQALGAATAAISRAGASSLAELAAMRVPAVLIPYPMATDNHQFHNARAFEATGAARLLEQKTATPELLEQLISDVIGKAAVRDQMRNALAQWHAPRAAEEIAESMLNAVGAIAGTDRCLSSRTATSICSPDASKRGGMENSERSQSTRDPELQEAHYKKPVAAGRVA